MNQGLLQARKLTVADMIIVQQMQTNIEDDYVLRIFPGLVQPKSNAVYGLFNGNDLVAIGGYTLFPGGYAMLGRLRSDHRFLSKGHGTEILSHIKKELEKDSAVHWIGANTNEANKPARRVLEKLGFKQITKLHSLPVRNQALINGQKGDVWDVVQTNAEKRELLASLDTNNIYPYECYYPFPFRQELLTNEHLQQSTFYQNDSNDRFLIIKNDQKGEWYAQVKYFWNDHFEQPGFWETISTYMSEQNNEDMRIWIDFSPQGFENIPNKNAFEMSDAWVLYGTWTQAKK